MLFRSRALLKQLQQQFEAFRNCLPLEIGIDKQLLARMPSLNRKLMRAALGIHTGSMRYLRAMEKATVRYDLDGKPGITVINPASPGTVTSMSLSGEVVPPY